MMVVTAVAEDDGDGQEDGEDDQVEVENSLVVLVKELSRLERRSTMNNMVYIQNATCTVTNILVNPIAMLVVLMI
jgi:hypothetical protein